MMDEKQFYPGQSVYRTDTDPPCWTYFRGWHQNAKTWQNLHVSRRGYVTTPDGGPDDLVLDKHLHDREVTVTDWEQSDDVWDKPRPMDEELDEDLDGAGW